ncbi:MAG: hypothetical protein GX488_05165 [Clostridiales bacterium]|nr:hypothetical protein [Clostridiales bacterium]
MRINRWRREDQEYFPDIPKGKGVIAEASEARWVDGAGLRENMSQTVTKVESYHWLEAADAALYAFLHPFCV